MDVNPLTRGCAEIQQQIDALQQSEQQVANELQWYRSIDPPALTDDLQRNETKSKELQLEIQALNKEIHENAARLSEIAPAVRTLLNPFNWFAKEQVDLRRTCAQLSDLGDQTASQRQSKIKELEDTCARTTKIASDLQRHRTFDFVQRQSDLEKIKQGIAAKEDELAVEAEHKRRVDEVLAPIVKEMQKLESAKRRAQSDLETAQEFDRRLSSAGTPYDRAKIHEECERTFGEGSPRRILVERQKDIRRLERDHDKMKRRAEDVGRKAARKIDTIVVDGNNLCYEGGTFIGLSAIETLLPLLAPTYSVIVVFDSAIRGLLNTREDSRIQKRLGSDARVHIVASRRLADETVLDLAEASESTYVLSNDRYADFNEKSVVRDGRVIRHEIVNGNVFVHELQLRAAYALHARRPG